MHACMHALIQHGIIMQVHAHTEPISISISISISNLYLYLYLDIHDNWHVFYL